MLKCYYKGKSRFRISLLFFPLQLSQSATSIDNRVPTPASVAELSTQQALPDVSSTEAKPHIKEEDGDFGKKQTEVKMEVRSRGPHLLHRVLGGLVRSVCQCEM